MADILYENDEARFVQLNQRFCETDGQLVSTTARFDKVGGAVLGRCYSLSGEPVAFFLSQQEADNFCSAWQQFKADEQGKAEAEKQRQSEAEAEAYRLVANWPAITVEKKDHSGRYTSWTVFIEETGWSNIEAICDADQFLYTVKECIEYYRPIQDAYDLVKGYPDIHINPRPGVPQWHICIDGLFGAYATQESIYTVAQKALEAYIRHQEQLTATNG